MPDLKSTVRSGLKTCLFPLSLMAAGALLTPLICEAGSSSAGAPGSIESIVKNHTYRLLVGERNVTLNNGSFSGGSKPGDRIEASLVRHNIADLNNDGTPDGVVIIEHHGMGSAGFYELSALVSGSGGYRQTRPVLLGDNIEIRNLDVSSGSMWSPTEISVGMLVHGKSDAHATPTMQKSSCYYLSGDELKECSEMPVAKKPALYLYPERPTRVEVRLSPKGSVIRSIPDYGSGWTVSVEKNGTIDRKYTYLFYEASLDKKLPLPDEGWSVSYDHLKKWFDENLKQLGLNRREAKDLRKYWLKALPKSPWYTIRVVNPAVVDDRLGLAIDPKPDSMLRLLLHFTPTTGAIELNTPATPPPFCRKGFTAVEWGGILGEESGSPR